MKLFTLAATGLIGSAYASGSCQDGYTMCAPSGATSLTSPKIGSTEFQNLLPDLLGSSLPTFKRDGGSASLCCLTSLSCLTLSNLAVPFCYDKFTTNFLLPDNSFGTVATGSYTSSNGDKANLLTGDYTLAAGGTGNIYASNPAAKPNTATLALPAQFTSSGVGGAVPVTSLGELVTLTYTTTLPGSTIGATTVSPTIIPGTTVSSVLTVPTLISISTSNSVAVTTGFVTSTKVSTAAGSTVLATTKEATTASAVVTTVTTTRAASVNSVAPSASSTKKSAASRESGLVWGMSLVVAGFVLLQ